jgi:hypothetical protein
VSTPTTVLATNAQLTAELEAQQAAFEQASTTSQAALVPEDVSFASPETAQQDAAQAAQIEAAEQASAHTQAASEQAAAAQAQAASAAEQQAAAQHAAQAEWQAERARSSSTEG